MDASWNQVKVLKAIMTMKEKQQRKHFHYFNASDEESFEDFRKSNLQRIESERNFSLAFKVILLTLIFATITLIATKSHAYTDQQAIRAVIGEASNQGFTGMLAVSEVIRQRGSLKGIYGFKSPHVDKEPVWVWNMAKKAWQASKTSRLTKGATHFENIKAFGKPKWAKNMKQTFKHKDHVFYKEA